MTAIALQDGTVATDSSILSSAAPDRLSETPRITANRANAQKSSGPRTSEGKAKSSRNATKHGLFSLTPPPELDSDPLFVTIEQELRDQLHPRSATQHTLLRQLAIQSWRLAQLPNYERDTLANLPDNADELTTLTKIWSLHDRAQARYQRRLCADFQTAWLAAQDLLRQRCAEQNKLMPPYDNDAFLAAQDAYLEQHGSPNLFSRHHKRNEPTASPFAPPLSACSASSALSAADVPIDPISRSAAHADIG